MDTLLHPFPRLRAAGSAMLALLAFPALLHAQLPSAVSAEGATLRPGQVLVIASWSCAFMQLDRVNQLGMNIIEEPLTRLVEDGRLAGWGQLNGEFRDEYNYHTFYLADSQEQYRDALSQVLNHVSGSARDDMEEFYQHCSQTQELSVRVVSSRP